MCEFERLLQNASRTSRLTEQRELLERAIAIYRGELLTGFFEEWVLIEQSRLRTLSIQALAQLCRLLEQAEEFEAALSMTTRLIAEDRLEESAYQTQMRLYLALGRPREALQTYEALQMLLRSELNSAPEETTQTLAKQALQAPHPSPAKPGQPLPAQLPENSETAASPLLATPSLPLQLTRCFGRAKEIAQVRHLLASNRLVTLLGPGGVGKTRLALEVARYLASDFVGSVVFVPLAELRNPALIPMALAGALKLPLPAVSDPFEQALQALNQRPYLLVLDNMEQLLEGAMPEGISALSWQNDTRKFVRTLLERAPQTTCLLTSRQPLHLAGEQEFPVSALLLPASLRAEEVSSQNAGDLRAYASIALYEDRVRLVKPDFLVTPTNARFVAGLCRRLEGMPLAIEMAAAWGRTLSPQKTLERLEKRLDLVLNRRSDLPMRHQSLRAAIEWSYNLLSPDLQALFAALSVFRGGWRLEACEAICDVGVQALEELAARSLIVLEENEQGDIRYRMLEILYEFAKEKREERGETETLRVRHAAYFLQIAEEATSLWRRGKKTDFISLQADHDNMRATLEWCLAAPAGVQTGLQLCGALSLFWEMHGHLQEGYTWCVTALNAEGGQERTEARASALCGAGRLAEFQQDPTLQRRYYEECFAIAREIGAHHYLAMCLNNLAMLTQSEGDYPEARRLFQEALALNRARGNEAGIARNLNNLGRLAFAESDYETAWRLYTECLSLNRKLGNRFSMAGNLNNLGLICFRRADYGTAGQCYEEALHLNRELGNRLWEAINLDNLGDVRFETGEEEAALELYQQALALNREAGYRGKAAAIMNSIGRVYHARSEYTTARSWYQDSLSFSQGGEDMVELILSVESIAFLLADEIGLVSARTPSDPSPEHAPPDLLESASLQQIAQLWGAVRSLRVRFPIQAEAEQKPIHDNRDAVRARLGDSVMEAAMAEGRTFSLEQTITLVQSLLR